MFFGQAGRFGLVQRGADPVPLRGGRQFLFELFHARGRTGTGAELEDHPPHGNGQHSGKAKAEP